MQTQVRAEMEIALLTLRGQTVRLVAAAVALQAIMVRVAQAVQAVSAFGLGKEIEHEQNIRHCRKRQGRQRRPV